MLKNKLLQIEGMNTKIGGLQDKIHKLVHENANYNDEIRDAQQNLRLSANQNQKITRELNEYKTRIEENTQENNMLKMKIQKITGENVSLGEEVRIAQQNLRLSANTQAKLNKELNEYRSRIDANDRQS